MPWRIRLVLAYRQSGPLPWAALALLACAALLQWAVLPRIDARVDAERAAAAVLARNLAAPPARADAAREAPALISTRLKAFEDALVPAGDAARSIEAVFAEAARRKIVLAQGEYKWGREAEGGYRTLAIDLPVKGGYPQVRQFADAVLAALPGAALEEVAFRRDAVASALPEARLRFVIFIRDDRP